MDKIKELTERLIEFRRQRDWEQFHKPKDLAISLCLESAELLEHFQWKSDEEISNYIRGVEIEKLKEETADIAIYLLLFCHDLKIDLYNEVLKKIQKNETRYPVEKAKGKADKYNKL
ncbi:MAG: nucleotide pyrophosphohydrolase [Thermodesulfovibrionales bacterium]|nr:nucleotide pyrophosphohydrolase [Thermodesulfovibrionales bacterium]